MRVWLMAGMLAAGLLGACGDGGDDGNGGASGGNADTGGTGGDQETVVGQGCEGVTPNFTISIGDAGFSVREIKVATGGVVQWTNVGGTDHSVISGEPNHSDAGALFNSGTLTPGESFCFTFNQAREVDFFCGLHPAEQGEIQVGGVDDDGRDRDGDDDNGGGRGPGRDDDDDDDSGDDSNRGGGNDDPDNPGRG